MKSIRTLDFTTLPELDEMDIFIRLDGEIEEELKGSDIFQEVYERSQAALMFVCQANKEYKPWRNAAYLRAGLNEFYSIEDAARRDCKTNGLQKPAMISASNNPLVHLMYLLRHVNVHAQISNTRIYDTSVISNFGESPEKIQWKAVILDRPTLEQVQCCNEAKKYYDPSELERATKWIDENQYIFGIGEVFRKGVSVYCRELLLSIEN
ncbi:MAG: hypothetical protein JZU65_20515 [Chlorobium sp.]|nr:hypothetical protein [Chlorobium sp.]